MGATPSAEQLRNDKCSKSYDTLKRYPHNTYWINKTRADCCAAAPGPHCQGFANINDDNLLEDFSNFSNLNDNVIEGMTSSAMKAKAATDLNSINRSRGIANAHARNAISNSYAYIDPGTGSFIIQAILAIASAIFFYMGYPIRIVKKFFQKIFKKKDTVKKNN